MCPESSVPLHFLGVLRWGIMSRRDCRYQRDSGKSKYIYVEQHDLDLYTSG